MNSMTWLVSVLDIMFKIIGSISIAIIALMPMYLIIKYKSIHAVAYWDYASRKETLIMNLGYLGFICSIILAVVSAVLGNLT